MPQFQPNCWNEALVANPNSLLLIVLARKMNIDISYNIFTKKIHSNNISQDLFHLINFLGSLQCRTSNKQK